MTELDAKFVGKARAQAKRVLRKRMRALRRSVPRAALDERSRRIVESVLRLPEWQAAERVGCFWPLLDRGEVDVRALHAVGVQEQKSMYYPFMDPSADGFTTGFRAVREVHELSDRGRGFSEPLPTSPAAEALDLVIVPALAASLDAHRLGYGIGFYDATLPDVRPPACAVVVVYDFALLSELPSDEHDVACDLVVTDAQVARAAAT
jgi:5-formyltetrahydrofolate cyclo-ligase